MTVVEFHTGIDDPLGYACRLLRKAYRQGLCAAVTAAAADLDALDRALWTFDDSDFVPHARTSAAAPLLQRTPLWLVDGAWPAAAPPLLVNVGAEPPPAPEALQRVVEIVGAEPAAAQAGRSRWRWYRSRGLEPVQRNASAGEAG